LGGVKMCTSYLVPRCCDVEQCFSNVFSCIPLSRYKTCVLTTGYCKY